MRYSKPFTAEEARERFNYDSESGRLTWRTARKSALVGRQLKCLDRGGYVQVNALGSVEWEETMPVDLETTGGMR